MKSADTRSPMAYRDDPKNWVAGLEKGLAIFDVFDAEHSRFTATEIANCVVCLELQPEDTSTL